MPTVQKLTRGILAKAPRAGDGRRRYYLLESSGKGAVRGFGARVGRSGMVWGVRYRRRWHPIARTDLLPLEEARKQARRLLLELTAPTVVQRSGSQTVKDLFDRFHQKHIVRVAKEAQRGYLSVWRLYILPRLGSRKLRDIRPEDVEELRDSISARYQANRAIQQLGMAYEYAITLGWIDRSPVRVARRRVQPRSRRVSAEELRKLGYELLRAETEGRLSPRAAAIFWAVLYTGCRPGEVQRCRREWAHLDGPEPHIRIPPGEAKDQSRERYIPLPEAVAARLRAVAGDDWLIPAKRHDGAYYNNRREWIKFRAQAGLPSDLQLRDIRAAVRSEAEALGVPRGHVQALLGHRPGSKVTDSVYLRPEESEARAAGEAVAAHLGRIMGLEQGNQTTN